MHAAESAVASPMGIKHIPKTARPLVPVACALIAIVPVVPTVDHLMEMAFEPTLGKFLGLEFEEHGHHDANGINDNSSPAADHDADNGIPQKKTE